jgi:peptidoglycan-associated lipoprotein
MNFTSRKLFVILLSAAVILTGCTKKPRPTPADTTAMMGTGSALTPTSVGTFDQSAGNLQPRADGVIEDADTIRNLLPSVYFDFDKSAIKPGERQKIADASDYLKKNPQYRMLLEGHCDWRGTAEYNLGLGDRRGQAVRQFLQNLGIQSDKVQILSKGSLGAAEKGSDEQMTKDRRVDFVVLKK